MSGDTVKLRLFHVGGTEMAYFFSTTGKNDREGTRVWVPRSQIEHVTWQSPKVNEWRECVVTMPLWLAENKGLC
jgi:hypothetical protein